MTYTISSQFDYPSHQGGATLADFVVMFARQAVPVFAHKSINQAQGRRLQLNKVLYKS